MRSIADFESRYPVKTFYTENADWQRCDGWRETETRNAALQSALQLPLKRVVYANQTHSANVLTVAEHADRLERLRETDVPGGNGGCDALVTAERSVLLCVRTADCLPLFFYDPDNHAAGIAHCGWRGVSREIAANTIRVMKERFGSAPERIIAAFGPGICADCYEVGADVIRALRKRFSTDEMSSIVTKTRSGRCQLDLRAAITAQLARAGIPPANVYDVGICSRESENFASFRRNGASAPFMQTLSGIVLQER